MITYKDGTPLTAIDIAALRKADSIVARHHKGESTVEAIKKAERTTRDPFAEERRHVIPCLHRGTDYGGLGRSMAEFEAFEMEHTAQMESVWSGPVAFLKPGDVLRLVWLADAGRSPALESGAPGWHMDKLTLHVHRGPSSRFVFLLEASVCQSNTSRMVRPAQRVREYSLTD